MPGDVRQPFANAGEARNVLNEAESELQAWHPNIEPIQTNAGGLGNNLMPNEDQTTTAGSEAPYSEAEAPISQQATTTTGHASAAVEDTANPVQGEGTHLEKAVAA